MTARAVDDDGACVAVLDPELLDELDEADDPDDAVDDPEDVLDDPEVVPDLDVVLDAADVPDVVVPVAEAWEVWPGNSSATTAERIPPVTRAPTAMYRVLRLIRFRPRSLDALEGMRPTMETGY